jgi:small subunit ribosomal protein S21
VISGAPGKAAQIQVFSRPGFTPAPSGVKYCGLPHPRPLLRPQLERRPVQVLVRDNNVDQALRALKKKMQREGIFREMKLRRNYEKPSERRAREQAEAVRRYRKLLRKRMEREGY